jgi:hypothetical protein
VIEAGGGTSFLLEAVQAFGISGERCGQNLDGNFALETGIKRAIDLSHATRAE